MNKDKKIFPWIIQNSIPTAFDDSLSFYEVLAKIWNEILNIISYLNNKLITKVNELITDRNNVIKAKINELLTSLKSYLYFVHDKINTEDNLRLKNTNLMNNNIDAIKTNNTNLKEVCDNVSGYSNLISETLYNGTYNVIKFESYNADTNTLNIKQTNTTYIKPLSSTELTDLTQLSTESNTIQEWNEVEQIETTISEVEKYE